jgi:hypothetical protein
MLAMLIGAFTVNGVGVALSGVRTLKELPAHAGRRTGPAAGTGGDNVNETTAEQSDSQRPLAPPVPPIPGLRTAAAAVRAVPAAGLPLAASLRVHRCLCAPGA